MPVKIISINNYARRSAFTKILKYGLTKNILPIKICSLYVFVSIITYNYYMQILCHIIINISSTQMNIKCKT